MKPEQAMQKALEEFPDCTYADWDNGFAFPLIPTIVVKLWRNQECYLNGDPPKHEKSYARDIDPEIIEKLDKIMIEQGYAYLV